MLLIVLGVVLAVVKVMDMAPQASRAHVSIPLYPLRAPLVEVLQPLVVLLMVTPVALVVED